MDRDWIGNIEPWGRMVHLTPMERQRTGPYGPVVYDVGIKASNFEKNQASQTLGRRNSRSEVTSIPHPEGPASVLTCHKPSDKIVDNLDSVRGGV